MNQDDHLLDHLRGLERALHSPATRRDPVQLDALLADDFMEIGRSGRYYDKTSVMAGFAGTSLFPTIQSDAFTLSRLASSVCLLTYRSAIDSRGELIDPASRVSIWIRRGEVWRLRFHQATPVSSYAR